MSEPDSHRTVSAVALAVTAVIVVIMAIWGFNSATAPIEDDSFGSTPVDNSDKTCAPGEVQTIVKFLRTDEVAVSVYNAGKKKGHASATLNLLENRGFKPGDVGDATDTTVQFAEIHAKQADVTEANLVALSFGKSATVVIDDEKDLKGPGVNIIIGDKFRKLKVGAPRQIKLPEAKITCE